MDQHVYFKNLDASRFFAFILVFLAHCFYTNDEILSASTSFQFIYHWGKVGVLGLEYFFVLSAFLISYIILKEDQETNNFNAFNFLARRCLRVWPLYFLIVSIGFVAFHYGNSLGFSVDPLPPLPYLLLFWVNYYIIDHGTHFLFFIAFLWSISVEEQFYLVWALLMKWVRHYFRAFCLGLIFLSLAFRWYWLGHDAHLYFHLISALGNFGIGGLLASSIFRKDSLSVWLANQSSQSTLFFYIILLTSILYYHELMKIPYFPIVSRLYFALLFTGFIADQTIGKNRLFNAGNVASFNYFGKISYGLYCFHGVVITLLSFLLPYSPFPQNLIMIFLIQPILIFSLTVLVSHFSYRYFESRFLKLKKKFYTFQK